jgi:mono/diheme cytochrome c family protein
MSAVDRRLSSLVVAIIIGVLTGGSVRAQDLDRDKSGPKLFATNCAGCHRSPRGLAKDRFSWTLSSFLRQHYTSNPASAQTLTAYLQSVDAPRARPRPAARGSRPVTTSAAAPSLRPPAPVPAR